MEINYEEKRDILLIFHIKNGSFTIFRNKGIANRKKLQFATKNNVLDSDF